MVLATSDKQHGDTQHLDIQHGDLQDTNVQDVHVEGDAAPAFVHSPLTTRVMQLLCGVALCVSGYLAWTALQAGQVFGCSGNQVFDCSHVLSSQWSKVWSVPVSVPAFALYASLLAVLAFMRKTAPEAILRMGWNVLIPGAMAAGLAALWFIGLQIFAIGHLCPYCLVAHTCGLALAGVVLYSQPLPRVAAARLSSIGLLATGGLIAVQLTSTPPETFQIERYAADSSTEDKVAEGAVIEFADDALFAPPGMEAAEESASEVFAPPGDVFQPPVASQPVSAPSSVDTAADSNETTPATKVDPSIVSTLLLLMPTRAATLDFLPVFIADESDESTASDQQTAESDEEPADSPRLISVAGNKFRLNSRHWPLIGNPDAKYIFVEMFDYTCPHCRRTHGSIAGACKRYGDDLAIIALPVPLDGKCNSTVSSTSSQHASSCEVSRLAVAVWRVKPSAFGEFHDWLFESTGNTRVSVARKKAEELVGTDALTAELANPYAGQYIEKHVDLYKRVGAGAVPKLLFPNATLTGAVSSTTTLCNTIDRELGSN